MDYDLQSQFPTLRNAPITEALIDIRVELPPEVDLQVLRKFYEGLELRFPRIDKRLQATATLQFKPNDLEIERGDVVPDGWVMRSDTEALIVQARLNGFTVNKLQPYSAWQHLRDQTEDLWRRYVEVARPTKITRLGVRYINRIMLPVGQEFRESILTFPEVASGIPQQLPEFFMRLVIPHKSGLIAIVTEASQPSTESGDTVPMLLDIDTFRPVELSAEEETKFWATLETLRAYKNLIFFKTITPALMEDYK